MIAVPIARRQQALNAEPVRRLDFIAAIIATQEQPGRRAHPHAVRRIGTDDPHIFVCIGRVERPALQLARAVHEHTHGIRADPDRAVGGGSERVDIGLPRGYALWKQDSRPLASIESRQSFLSAGIDEAVAILGQRRDPIARQPVATRETPERHPAQLAVGSLRGTGNHFVLHRVGRNREQHERQGQDAAHHAAMCGTAACMERMRVGICGLSTISPACLANCGAALQQILDKYTFPPRCSSAL